MAEIFNFSFVEIQTKNEFRSFSYKKMIKDKMTRRVDIRKCIFEKTVKKLKLKKQDPKKAWFFERFQSN